VKNQAKKYRELMKEEEVKDRVFTSRVELLPTEVEQAQIQQMMNNLIAANPEITNFMDVFKIVRVSKENSKLASLLIKNSQRRFLNWQSETATKNSQENGQIQQQSLEAKAKFDNDLADKQQNNEERNLMLKGAFSLMEKGITIDPSIQAVLNGVILNVGIPLAAENEIMKNAAIQAQQEQAEQMQGQEQPNEQPMIEQQEQPQMQVA
jgi:hypothetical protein